MLLEKQKIEIVPSLIERLVLPLPPLNAVKAFDAVARHGSIAAAAAELNVSPSAVSRLVKLLEARLGARLCARRPSGLALTELGEAYAREISPALERIEAASAKASGARQNALLIGAGPTLAMRWLIPRLPAFHAAHPKIEVRLSTAIERADPIAPDWHAAIRAGDGRWSGLEADFLFTADLFPVCAPALAARLAKPGDLKTAVLLDAANAPDDWQLWLAAAGLGDLDLAHAQRFDYAAFALQAAIDGLGVAMARAPFVADDLAAGRLVRPFKLAVPKGKGWYLISRRETRRDPALTAFRSWILDHDHAPQRAKVPMVAKRSGARATASTRATTCKGPAGAP